MSVVVNWLLLLRGRLRIVLVLLRNWDTTVIRQRVIRLRNLLMDLRVRMWMMRVAAVSRARVGGHFVEVGCVGEMSGEEAMGKGWLRSS
jgi:hypothetical protein